MKIILIFFIVSTLITPVYADSVVLKSGKIFEGKIIDEKEDACIVKIEGGTVSFNKAQIESIIYGEPSEEQIKTIEEKGYVTYEGKWIKQDKYDKLITQERQAQRHMKTKQIQEKPLTQRSKRPEPISRLKIGMTKKEVIECMGNPYDINKTTNSSGVREQWVYGSVGSIYVYIENGIVTSWQD